MKKANNNPGLFEIIGAVLSFLAGCCISDIVCNTLVIEGYVLRVVLYFSITLVFSWLLMKAGRRLDEKRKTPPEDEDDDDNDDD